MKKLDFEHKKLIIGDEIHLLNYVITEARIINDLAIMIYKFDDSIHRHGQFKNCQTFNETGELIWTAEHPTNATADFYINFMDSKKNKL